MTRRDALIHCNAGAKYGMGHLMRALALGQEAMRRGWNVAIVGDISESARKRVHSIAPELSVRQVAPDRLAETLRASIEHASLLHIDSYWNVPDLDQKNLLLSNMQDGPYGVRRTHLAIDANLGAEKWFERPDLSTHRIIGVAGAIIREQVRQQQSVPRMPGRRPRVLVVMGGTDPNALAARVAEALAALPVTMDVTVVAAPEHHERISEAYDGTSHELSLRAFIDDLPAAAQQQDMVISAAGTSVWDFAFLGVPMALVCAVDNQRRGYRAAIDMGFAVPLGEPPHDGLTSRILGLAELLSDRPRVERIRERLRARIDGLGAWRIVSAWEELLDAQPTDVGYQPVLSARRATASDAETLFRWRNDETTRSASRTSAPLAWEDHCEWLNRTLASDDRQLFLMVEEGNEVATVRWDRRAESDWEVSITIDPARRGRGLGRAVLSVGEDALDASGPVRMLASIHGDNTASRRLFRSARYLPHLPADRDGFETRAKWRLPAIE